jgi:cobalamin biosynthesis protein CobT
VASEAAVERSFSMQGLIHSKLKNRMSDDRVEREMFIKFNSYALEKAPVIKGTWIELDENYHEKKSDSSLSLFTGISERQIDQAVAVVQASVIVPARELQGVSDGIDEGKEEAQGEEQEEDEDEDEEEEEEEDEEEEENKNEDEEEEGEKKAEKKGEKEADSEALQGNKAKKQKTNKPQDPVDVFLREYIKAKHITTLYRWAEWKLNELELAASTNDPPIIKDRVESLRRRIMDMVKPSD